MSQSEELSAYITFGRSEWAALRFNTPLTLSEADLPALRGLNEPITPAEVADIYLPLTRLLNLHFTAARSLMQVKSAFLGRAPRSAPYIVALAGSVAVGKSTFARVLCELLARWPDHRRVELVTTDGFLYPNAVLQQRNLMHRKGFPESYDRRALLRFVAEVKSGATEVRAPRYSHLTYDILPGDEIVVHRPDVLIVEGLNVLQPAHPDEDGRSALALSDFFDFSIYVDADPLDVRRWYVERFLRLRETAFTDPNSYFHRYADLTDFEAVDTANQIWASINEPNLVANILPTRGRATLVMTKGSDHAVSRIRLRKL